MNKKIIGITALLTGCPKTQKTHTFRLEEIKSTSQILATSFVEQELLSERYEGLYSNYYETALGDVMVYYKPEGVDVTDAYTLSGDELFTDEEYFNDILVLAMQTPTSMNYIDVGLNGELDTLIDGSGSRMSYELLAPEAQAQYGAIFELVLSEIIEQIQQEK